MTLASERDSLQGGPASLQSNTKRGFTKMAAKKKLEAAIDQDLSDRLIISLVFDLSTLGEEIEQLKGCIYGLARQRGLVDE